MSQWLGEINFFYFVFNVAEQFQCQNKNRQRRGMEMRSNADDNVKRSNLMFLHLVQILFALTTP